MEGPTSRAHEPRIWREIEELARIVRDEDPRHPIATVLAGAPVAKIRAVRQHVPSIDILGVNSYGPASLVAAALDEAGWDRAWMLTEFGPRGPWESRRTPWGAPIEPTAGEKVAHYVAAHRSAVLDPRCLGTFPFTWGQKQEATPTWFGMFLKTGEKTPVVDALAREICGRYPANRSPRIRALRSGLALARVAPGEAFEAMAETDDPDGDPLTYEWVVMEEVRFRSSGGDPEPEPPAVEGCIDDPGAAATRVTAPRVPGAYRLFLYVRDGRGGGDTENVPFEVQ